MLIAPEGRILIPQPDTLELPPTAPQPVKEDQDDTRSPTTAGSLETATSAGNSQRGAALPSPRGQPLHTRYTRRNQILIATFRELLFKLIKYKWDLSLNVDVVSIIVLYTFERTHEFVPHVKVDEMTRKLHRSVLGSLTACPAGSVSPVNKDPTRTIVPTSGPISPTGLPTLSEEPTAEEKKALLDPQPVMHLEPGVDYKLNFLIGRVLYGFDIHDSPYAAPTDPNPLEIMTDSPQGGLFLVPTKMSDWFLNQDGTCIALPVRYRYKHRIVDATVKARETGPYVQITIQPLNVVNPATDQLHKETEEAIARGELGDPADLEDFASDTSFSEPELTESMIDQTLIDATAGRTRHPDPLMESIHQSYRSSRPSQLVFVGDPSGSLTGRSSNFEKKDLDEDLVEGLDAVREEADALKPSPRDATKDRADAGPPAAKGLTLSSQSDADNKSLDAEEDEFPPEPPVPWASDRKSEPTRDPPPNSPPNVLGPGNVSPHTRTTDKARRWKGRGSPAIIPLKKLPKFDPPVSYPHPTGHVGLARVHPNLRDPPAQASVSEEDADGEGGGTSSDSSLSGPGRPAWGPGGLPKRKKLRRKLRAKARAHNQASRSARNGMLSLLSRDTDDSSDDSSDARRQGLPALGGSKPVGARASILDRALDMPRFGGTSENSTPAPKLQNSASPPRRARPSLIATTGSPGQDRDDASGRSVLELGPGYLGIDELSLSYLHCRVTPNPHQDHSYTGHKKGTGLAGADVAFPS